MSLLLAALYGRSAAARVISATQKFRSLSPINQFYIRSANYLQDDRGSQRLAVLRRKVNHPRGVMEQPTLMEFFQSVQSQNTLQVTSGAHPVVEGAFDKVVDTLCGVEDPRLEDLSAWLRQVLEYNVPEGKRNRLLAVMLAYQSMEKENISPDKLELAAILGWCVELLQAFFLICDDIMDNSVTRRGKKCWYKLDGVNMIAINDSILLDTAVYRILKHYFRQHPSYMDIVELFHEVSFQTSSGQCLDMLSEKQGTFLEDRYNAIILYKTAFYSFSLPIRLGMYLAGISDPATHKKAELLAIKVGHIFQVQDDFLDCYGTPEVIGKVGTDIVDAKCSWLIVKALQVATPDQKKVLMQNYGQGEPGGGQESIVKTVYEQLKMDEMFREFEDQAFAQIRDEVEKLELGDSLLRPDIFKLLANKIYRRNK